MANAIRESGWCESDLDSMNVARPNAHYRIVRLIIDGLDRLEPFQELHQHKACLGRDEHMRRTDSRPATKGNEFPHWSDILPALRAEDLSVSTPDVGVAVHEIPIAVRDIAFLDENGGLLVWAAADGKGGVAEGYTHHLHGVGIETVSL